MVTVKLLCRKIKSGKAYSIYLRYYDTNLKKVIGSETLNLEVSKNYFSRGENTVERISAKDKTQMQLAENILIQRKSEILGDRFSISLIENRKEKVNIMKEIEKEVEIKGHRTYFAMLHHLKKYVNEGSKIEEEMEGFQVFLLNQNKKNGDKLSQTSVHHYMNRMRIIMDILEEKRIIPKKIQANIIKENRKETVYLSVEEIQRIMNTEVDEKYKIIKYAYLFSCFTGLRRSDILNLKWADVCGSVLKIWTIKTKSQEEIVLPETALYILSLLEKGSENVFKFSVGKIAKALDYLAKKAEIDKKIRFHSSRHTFGTVLYEAGVDIYTVQKLLTHKNIASTMIYAHIKNADKKKAVDKLPNLKMK